MHIITTCLEQLYEIPLKSETYEQETSLWIDALASYLRRIAPGCVHIPLKSKEDAVHATFQIQIVEEFRDSKRAEGNLGAVFVFRQQV